MKGVTVKDLMINYPHIYKIFFGKAISKNRKKKKNSIIINIMRTSVNAKIIFFRENPVIFRTLSKVTITLNDSVKFRGLINLNAEINYIDKATYKQLLGVIIIPNLNMKMISHSNHRVPFIKIYKNVRLAIGPIKYEIYLFIIDIKTSHSLMLGLPFIFQFNLSLGTEKDTGR
jgi:hypothetical protein